MNSNQSEDTHKQNAAASASAKEEIRQFFDDMSVGRNETIRANPIISYEQELRARTVLGLLAVQPGERILDIGCGNARDIARIAELGGEVVGVDISAGMVAAARKELERMGKNDIALQVGDATNLDFPDASFDKVLCSEVIEHIPDTPRALREMRRILKPGGSLVLSTPNRGSWYGFERYWLWEKVLRRKWPHPCDEWRTMAEVLALVEHGRLKLSEHRSVCFVPGFMVTYFILPSVMQRFVVWLVGILEPLMQSWFRNRGYTVCIKAVRDGV